jgi:hypothetical protein
MEFHMSVMEKTVVCTLPTDDSPSCGCDEKTRTSAMPQRQVVGVAAMSGLAAMACASCCILPFTLPAVLLANIGGVIVVLDHAHIWVTRGAIGAVVCAWGWLIFQVIRTGKRPTRSSGVMMVVATALTLAAASWPGIEPMAFHALGISKKPPVSQSD